MNRKQLILCGSGILIACGILLAGLPEADSGEPSRKDMQKVIDKAVDYLKSSQGENGSFSPKIRTQGFPA